MRLMPRRAAQPEIPTTPEAPAIPMLFGYECPCGDRIESLDERELSELAWAHAHRCRDEIHIEARRHDPTYGHPDHFFYEGAP